jgi:hypothetical protein
VVINQSDWGRRVWRPDREAAGLTGDETLPVLDPRRRALQVKDLRAYAASVVVDSGGTQYEAATLRRAYHEQVLRRALDEHSQDPARAMLRLDLSLTLDERIDALGNRLVRILHGCLRHHTTYDETTAWGHRANTANIAA